MAGCLCLRQDKDDIRVLDYRHSSLDYIPSDVFRHERTLEELIIDANGIKELPRELFCCHGLRKLSLADNEVRTIPPAIASLIHLEELDVSKNGVVNIPDNIKYCKHLRVIEASVNPLGKLPEGFTQLHQLTELYLNDAFIDFLPGSFGRLSKLKILEMRENHLKTLPRSLSHMLLLQRIDIGNNDFTELPDVIGNLTCLLELWCDSNQIKILPPCLGNLRQLMFLDVSKNRVESIPAEIEGCVALADLHLSTNLLQKLPESLGRLSNLTTLKVDDNRLTSLPFSIGGLVSLSELTISGNDLEEIPPSIGLLRHLRTVYADENFLVEIPPEMGSCSGLTVLSLRSNNLTFIPDEIGRIPRLRVLNLSDNKIRHLPFSLTRLKELQALWLAENQTKPLIRLQSDIDIDTGQRMLTCYLLPQQSSDDKDDNYSEAGSFHPSLWEEERAQRQQIHFDTDNIVEDEEGKLRRQPTPYPKEMKHRIQHMRNLALKQLNVPNSESKNEPTASNTAPEGTKVLGRRDSPIKTTNSGVNAKPNSPMVGERHHLLHADKEKFMKDKARIQHNRQSHGSQQSIDSVRKDPRSLDQDDGGFLDTSVRRRGSVSSQASLPRSVSLDRNIPEAQPLLRPESKSQPNITNNGTINGGRSKKNVSYQDFLIGLAARGVPVDDGRLEPRTTRSFPTQRHSASHLQGHHGHHSYHNYHPMPRSRGRRGTGYDSDTGYRSDGYRGDGGYLSDTGYRSDHGGYRHRHNGHGGPSGYSSDYGYQGHPRSMRNGGSVSDMESFSSSRHQHDPRRNWANTSHNQSNSHNNSNTQAHSSQGYNKYAKSQDKYGRGSYSNIPVSKRTTIRNDEMYEQQACQASDFARHNAVPRSRSTGEELRSHASGHMDSFHRQCDRSDSVNSDSRSISRSVSEPIREEEKIGSHDSDQWKTNLYKASVQLQKSPHDKQRQPADSPSRVSESNSRQINDMASTTSPPYRPAPPYSASRTTSQHSLHVDNQSVTGTPRSQRSERGQQDDRPSTLTMNGTSHAKRQLYQQSGYNPGSQSTLNRSRPDLSINTDCGVDNNHNSPVKTPVKPEGQSGQGPGPPGILKQTTYSQSSLNRTPSNPPGTPQNQTHPSNTTHTHTPKSPWNQSNYEKDIAIYKQMEPPSQVSSSTDSGYGHLHLFDRTPGDNNRSSISTSSQPSPVGPNQGTPTKHVFHVSLRKNPGLGFSIAGGVGSPGNPFRPGDLGIFITRVQTDGPGAGILQSADKILEVNGVDFTQLDHSRAVDALRHSGQDVSLVIERL